MYPFLQNYLPPAQAHELAQTKDLPCLVRKHLAQELRQELQACAAYIPSCLVRSQLANPTPGRIRGDFWQGSLLFADLSGFTRLCDRLSVLGKQGAEEVSGVINNLFNVLVAKVFAYHGELLKFGGDALTAFFDVEQLGSLHANAAVHAALEMQEQMRVFDLLETRAGTFRLGLRVGVHSGEVFAAEVGNGDHIELVVTGSNVNLVAQAQGIATPGEVVVTQQTAALLEDVQRYPKGNNFYLISDIPTCQVSLQEEKQRDDHHDDLNTLETLAHQLAALKPYLVRGLPRRFLESTSADVGEFRPVCVLFANFYDFSTLLQYIGDDAMLAANVLNAYFCRAQEVVHTYDGIINKVDLYTHGDKLMVLFGAPVAHEDDPLRAVHCGLALKNVLADANAEITQMFAISNISQPELPHAMLPANLLRQRIGINAGTVFAGRLGGKQRYEYTVMGPAVNLSSRLMEHSHEGNVLLSPDIRNAVNQYIELRDLPPVSLKGLEEPIVPVLALDSERHSIQEVKQMLPQTPLIGRDADLAILLSEARAALQGKGRVLAIVGDVGVGKTRIAEDLVKQLVMASINQDANDKVPCFQIVTASGQSFRQSVPYFIFRVLLSQLLGVHISQDVVQKEVGSAVEQPDFFNCIQQIAPEIAHFSPVLGDVLGISLEETAITRSLSAEQRYSRVKEMIDILVQRSSMQEPLFLLIDDIHWADASSLDILSQIVESIPTHPIVVVLCYRSDTGLSEIWNDMPQTYRHVLRELNADERLHLLGAMLNGNPPDSVVDLLERTQGNPFFIEELVRTLVVSGKLAKDQTGQWLLTIPAEQVAVPTSIEGLIMERLDRLEEPYQELVQTASVIGHRFQFDILQGLYEDQVFLHQGLQKLQESAIITMEDKPEEISYVFHHVLLRDVAYEGILYSQRRILHQRVAQCIETIGLAHLDENLAVVGRHYLLAEAWEPAFHYHLVAGVQAQKRYANKEALLFFATALDIGQKIEKEMREGGTVFLNYSNGIDEQRELTNVKDQDLLSPIALQLVELHERSGDVYVFMGTYDEALKSYTQALTRITQSLPANPLPMAEEAPNVHLYTQLQSMRVRIHRLLANVQELRADYDTALDWLNQGMSLAKTENKDELARCYLLGASIYQRLGQYEQSLEWARLGLSVAKELAMIADQAYALLLMGNLWRDQGEFQLSIPALEQACGLLDKVKDATRLSDAQRNLGDTYWCVGRWKESLGYYQRSLQISENIGDVMGQAQTSNKLAHLMVSRGDLGFAAELYEYSTNQFRRIGSLIGLATTGYYHGELLLLDNRPREALHLFRASMKSLERIKARKNLSEVLRLCAEAALQLEEIAEAQAYSNQSLDIACELGMVGDEALAWRVQGQIALKQEDFAAAGDYLQRSHDILERLENQYEMGKVLYWQARLAYVQENYRVAMQRLHLANKIFKALRAKRDIALVGELLVEIEAINMPLIEW